MQRLEGRTTIVTGASRGIPRRLVDEGAGAVVTGRRQEALDEAVASLGGPDVRTVAHREAGTRPVPRSWARPSARLVRRPLHHVVTAAGLQPVRVPSPHTWQPADLPRVVALLRRSSGWSASASGRRVGVSGGTVRRWEIGAAVPSPGACQRLERVHGLPRDSFTRLRREHPLSGRTIDRIPGLMHEPAR